MEVSHTENPSVFPWLVGQVICDGIRRWISTSPVLDDVRVGES